MALPATANTSDRSVVVWDLPTRLFHWALIALIITAWFTGEGEAGTGGIHRLAGEVIAGMLVFRLVWGFVGGEHARFSDFAAGPAAIASHVSDLLAKRPKRHLGHKPLGGLAVFLLLLTVAILVLTGLFSGGEDHAGPFARLWGLDLSEVHEVAFRALPGLAIIHLVGVAVETWKAKDALVPAMITGRKRRRADEPGNDARRAGVAPLLIARLLGVAVAAALMAAPASAVYTHADGGLEHESGSN